LQQDNDSLKKSNLNLEKALNETVALNLKVQILNDDTKTKVSFIKTTDNFLEVIELNNTVSSQYNK
jgi:hypothetical protein